MLHANGIVPRNPKLLESQEHTLDTTLSSGKGEYSELKKEAKSASESDDEDSKREKALLVRFLEFKYDSLSLILPG